MLSLSKTKLLTTNNKKYLTMKTEFINDFYKTLEEKTNPTYIKSLKKLIDSDELSEDSLEKLIQEVI